MDFAIQILKLVCEDRLMPLFKKKYYFKNLFNTSSWFSPNANL